MRLGMPDNGFVATQAAPQPLVGTAAETVVKQNRKFGPYLTTTNRILQTQAKALQQDAPGLAE
jgi:hypothetical protein